MKKYRYSLRYRRNEPGNRVYHLTVTASDPDEARAMARLRDPRFHSTVRSPKRLAELVAAR